ncbi:cardiolipin synthase [Pontiella sulfatireligans]|uniref:Cardiolipin synthase n=1 Tax=Pontiella sulfatireligans TaxID=2750658 RepID=A0A6C2UWA6_9BACT|nr:cardiolipin synthase [Pontiella sulfatireligans]VGO23474.1 Cardiolipin synthase A [Pontiella sulfatireligans]
MNDGLWTGTLYVVVHVLLQVAFILRVLLRPHREPASRIAWVVVIVAVPALGMLAYILFGETNIGRRRVERTRAVIAKLPKVSDVPGLDAMMAWNDLPERHAHLFQMGKTINGLDPVGGNRAKLLENSTATIASIVADIDAAKETVHLLFYIWLTDGNGCKVAEALKRAAARGVTCRAMADGLGSRGMIKSKHWKSMREAGVHLAEALPIGNPLLRPLKGRIDLRNHRKIVVIDNLITYCGSQNCADPEFLVKAKYAPWVDVMTRLEGPVVRQNQGLFASDWEAGTGENINDLLTLPMPALKDGFAAQVVGTGPTNRYSAMPEMFETLMYAARRKLVISTPYYVPNEAMQAGLCACARRGVDATIIFPARNDSWIVGAASRSYYAGLLAAGVKIFEFEGGLLHAKTLTLDGEVALIGSANMDRRSFELNYENNILLYDPALTSDLYERQESFIADSHPVTVEMVAGWSRRHRLFNNAVAMFGPVL